MDKVEQMSKMLGMGINAVKMQLMGQIGPVEERRVAVYEEGELFVSTVYAPDTGSYETAIGHPFYDSGSLIIVEEYGTIEEAQTGHAKWLALMTADNLPNTLTDVHIDEIYRKEVNNEENTES